MPPAAPYHSVLQQPSFRLFSPTDIRPTGWLARQLRLQADGLSGHLDEFWPDVMDSGWVGGAAEGWERLPYWLDGVIPLAWLLDDDGLKRRIHRYVDYIIRHQAEDGWLGPLPAHNPAGADLWARQLALKMLVEYWRASGDQRVPGVVEKALRQLNRHVDTQPLTGWGCFRWFETLVAVWWLYDLEPAGWLVDLAAKLHAQGFDWCAFVRHWPNKAATPKGYWHHAAHVVNNAMALKAGALWWRLSGEAADRGAPARMIGLLDEHHGLPTGIFTGDECLAGTGATQGTELCAVVEYMYSLECLMATLGEVSFADRLERIAFNALPATFSADMWSHQYDQQLNQVECSERSDRNWTTNGPDANLFGLAPNYGCCTANLSQGWPKFAAHLWLQTSEPGIAAVAYAPSCLSTQVRGIPVSVELETEYPFRPHLRFVVQTAAPVEFPLLVRLPGWCRQPALTVDGARVEVGAPGAFQRLRRRWEGRTEVLLDLPMAARLEPRPNGAVSLLGGPLVYALPIGEQWRRTHHDHPHRELPHADWEVHPTSAWNWALRFSPQTLEAGVRFTERPLGEMVFARETPPVTATVQGCRVPGWTAHNGSAQATPASPVRCAEPPEPLELIPYGSTRLRIAEFPVAAAPDDPSPHA